MDSVLHGAHPRPIDKQYEYDRIADRKRVDFIAGSLGTLAPGASVLDVGCGNGVIARHLGRLGYEVLGIDVSEKTIQRAKEATRLQNVRFATQSAEDLVASGQRYDAVICSEVLEHLNDPGVLLKVLKASLKDDGTLIVTVPNGHGPRESFVTKPVLRIRQRNGFMWRMLSRMKNAMGYSGTTVQSAADNLDHVQFFSRRDLRALAAANGFQITSWGKANFVEDVFPFSFFAKRMPVLQRMDCKIADILPAAFTGGFFSVWKKVAVI